MIEKLSFEAWKDATHNETQKKDLEAVIETLMRFHGMTRQQATKDIDGALRHEYKRYLKNRPWNPE